MAGEVRLTLVSLEVEAQQYTFTEPAVCTVGRGDDCAIVVPRSVLSGDVSRHHCQVQVGFDPVRVLVRDLESLNGTYVNGERIGQRFTASGAPVAQGQMVLLRHGDELRLGFSTTFRVEIHEHAEAFAGAEPPESPDPPGGLVGAFASLVRGWRRASER